MSVLVQRPFRLSEAPMDRAVRLFRTRGMRLKSLVDYHREGLLLLVRCGCGHVAVLASGPLIANCAKCSASVQIDQLVRRLKCAACGAPPVEWGPA